MTRVLPLAVAHKVKVITNMGAANPQAAALVIKRIASDLGIRHLKIAAVTGDAELEARTWRVAEHAMGRASQQRYGQAGIVNACALLLGARKLILIENPNEPHLVTIANRNPDPRRVDLVVAVGLGEPPALTDGVLPPTDRPAAYLCQGQTCLPAVTEPEMLEQLLRPQTARS